MNSLKSFNSLWNEINTKTINLSQTNGASHSSSKLQKEPACLLNPWAPSSWSGCRGPERQADTQGGPTVWKMGSERPNRRKCERTTEWRCCKNGWSIHRTVWNVIEVKHRLTLRFQGKQDIDFSFLKSPKFRLKVPCSEIQRAGRDTRSEWAYKKSEISDACNDDICQSESQAQTHAATEGPGALYVEDWHVGLAPQGTSGHLTVPALQTTASFSWSTRPTSPALRPPALLMVHSATATGPKTAFNEQTVFINIEGQCNKDDTKEAAKSYGNEKWDQCIQLETRA